MKTLALVTLVFAAGAILSAPVYEAVVERRARSGDVNANTRRLWPAILLILAISTSALFWLGAVLACFGYAVRTRYTDVTHERGSQAVAGKCFEFRGEVAVFRWPDTGKLAVDSFNNGMLVRKLPPGTRFRVRQVEKESAFEYTARNVFVVIQQYPSEIVDASALFDSVLGSDAPIRPKADWLKPCSQLSATSGPQSNSP